MLRTLVAATILAGELAGSAMAQAPDAGCALPSEPIPIRLPRSKFTVVSYPRICGEALGI